MQFTPLIVLAFALGTAVATTTISPEETSLAVFGDASETTWIRAKRSCGSCCAGGSCCGTQSLCSTSCCSVPVSLSIPTCPCAGTPGCSCGCPCAGMAGCSCGGGCPCAGSPGCGCSSSLVIPAQLKTCCRCCQPVCAPACINGGGCACGCNRGGCRRKRDAFEAISAYEATRTGAAMPASNL